MVHGTGELAAQAQLQGGDEGADALFGVKRADGGYQDAHSLGLEVAVQVQAIDNRLFAARTTGACVLHFAVLPLHAAALAAQGKALARHDFTSKRSGRILFVATSEVHLPERGGGYVLETKRLGCVRGGIGSGNGVGRKIGHQLPRVEQGLAIIALIHDAASAVRRGGMHQPQAEHFAALSGVCPERVAATRAGGMVVARIDVLAIGAGGAQPPPLDGRPPHVDAANGHLAATGVELVFRGEFAERGHCGTQVVIDNPVVFGRIVLAVGVPENHGV